MPLDLADEGARALVARRLEDLGRRTLLDDRPVIHEDDAVGGSAGTAGMYPSAAPGGIDTPGSAAPLGFVAPGFIRSATARSSGSGSASTKHVFLTDSMPRTLRTTSSARFRIRASRSPNSAVD